MDIGNRLKILRVELLSNKKLTRKQFGEQIGVSEDVIKNIEYNRAPIKEHMVKLICQTFNVNEDWLRNGNEPIFNGEEENLIKSLKNKYQLDEVSTSLLTTFVNLDEFSKKNIIDFLLKSIEDYYTNNPDKLKELNLKINTFEEMCITKDEDIKNIQLYEIPASAGTGMLITDDIPYEIKQIDLTIAPQARKADFALYVRGDSMEPVYYDGDIVFIKEQPSLDNGQIGIFIYDDEAYIKKYSIQEDGTYLVSLNKKYPPIKIEENICFKICGLVL